MKLIFKALCIFLISVHVTNGEDIDISAIGELLGLKDVRLISEDVTARESEARDIPFTSVKIISAPTDDRLFPLIIYTAPLGQINTEEYKELKKELLDPKTKSRSDYAKTMGFLFKGKDEAFAIMEEVEIASNHPPRPGNPRPWQPSHIMGISIVGSLRSENMDFQIFVIGSSIETAEKYPDYKKFFENPINFREFGKELYVTVKRAGLLGSKDVIKVDAIDKNFDQDNTGKEAKRGIKAGERQSSKEPSRKTYGVWIVVGFFLLGLGYFILKSFKKRNNEE